MNEEKSSIVNSARTALTSAENVGASQIIYPFCDESDCWEHAKFKFGKYEEYRVFYYCKEHLRKVMEA